MFINDPKAPAGDRFFDGTRNDVTGNGFTYISHDFNSPCSEPAVEINPIGITYSYIPGNCFNEFDTDEPCGPAINPCDIPCASDQIIIITSELDSLNSLRAEMNERLAAENVIEIFDEIEKSTDEYDLKAYLLDKFPLSDTVLILLSQDSCILSSSSLYDIFAANSVMSTRVINEIVNNCILLDSSDIARLVELQINYLSNPTISSLNYQIVQKQKQKIYNYDEIVRMYADSDSVTQIIQSLIQSSIESNNQTLYSTYLNSGLLDSARIIMTELSSSTTIDPDWITVQNILLALYSNNLTVFDIDSLTHSILFSIAEKSGGSLATANARSILKLVFEEIFLDGVEGESLRVSTKNNENKTKNNQSALTIVPNPSNGVFNIITPLNRSGIIENLSIYDAYGHLVFVNKSFHFTNKIDLTHLKSGIYVIIIKEGTTYQTSKLVIMN